MTYTAEEIVQAIRTAQSGGDIDPNLLIKMGRASGSNPLLEKQIARSLHADYEGVPFIISSLIRTVSQSRRERIKNNSYYRLRRSVQR